MHPTVRRVGRFGKRVLRTLVPGLRLDDGVIVGELVWNRLAEEPHQSV
jgi:hypothetical protein